MLPENMAQATLPGTLPLWLSLTLLWTLSVLGGLAVLVVIRVVWDFWRKR